MKKVLLSIYLMVVAVVFSACAPGSVAATRLYEPYYILGANMPFADTLTAGHWDTVKELEQDSYGRRYFRYSTFSSDIYQHIEIHIICQKTESDNAYYYPDYCYIFRAKDSDPFTQEDIALLKERNDWDSPLDEDKMYHCSINASRPRTPLLYPKELEPIVQDYLNLSTDYGVASMGLEIREGHQQLFLVCVYLKDSPSSQDKYVRYLLVYDQNETQPIIAMEEIEFSFDCQDVIHDFRMTWFPQ